MGLQPVLALEAKALSHPCLEAPARLQPCCILVGYLIVKCIHCKPRSDPSNLHLLANSVFENRTRTRNNIIVMRLMNHCGSRSRHVIH
jgi:hypothetical protein